MGSSRNTTVSVPSSSKHPASAPKKKSANRPQHKKHPHSAPSSSSNPNPNALPGVQKIKAALRQTRRLLAKDSLAADVRVATERRLKSLEGDLARAEQARVERTLATRYHKVKFFERQKVLRKLAQAKRQLDGWDGEGEEALGKKERRKLEKSLGGLRVDLNYVLHYPKAKKYISLFPPEARKGGDGEGDDDGEMDENEEQGKAETDRQREEIRTWVREQMEAGALSSEPEVEVEKSEGGKGASTAKLSRPPSLPARAQKQADSGKLKLSSKPAKGGVADDEFFGADDDDEGEEGGTREEESDEDSEMDED